MVFYTSLGNFNVTLEALFNCRHISLSAPSVHAHCGWLNGVAKLVALKAGGGGVAGPTWGGVGRRVALRCIHTHHYVADAQYGHTRGVKHK